jgi:hypothetical protein
VVAELVHQADTVLIWTLVVGAAGLEVLGLFLWWWTSRQRAKDK